MVLFPTATLGIAAALEAIEAVHGLPPTALAPAGLQIRAGLHFGDLRVFDKDLYGTTVNIAARLEGKARPGTLCIADSAYDQAKQLPCSRRNMGQHQLKGVPGRRTLFLLAPESMPIEPPKGPSKRATVIAATTIAALTALGFITMLRSGPSPRPPAAAPAPAPSQDAIAYSFRTGFGSFNVDNDTEFLEFRVRRMIVQPLWSNSNDREFRALAQVKASPSAQSFHLTLKPGLVFHPHRCHDDKPRPAGA